MLNFFKCYFVLFLLFIPFDGKATNVKILDVQSVGTGPSYQQAVNSGLLEALAQINGKSIESEKIQLTLESSSSNPDQEYYSSDAYANLIKEKTKGAISSYQIISSSEDDRGRWTVQVNAQIAKFNKPKSANRKRIVIMPLQFLNSKYTIAEQRFNAVESAKVYNDLLTNELVQTRKFAVLSRESEVDKELAIAASNKVALEEVARLGQTLVADYVLISRVTNFSYKNVEKKMRTSDRTYKVGSGNIKINYKLIDVSTSQIAFADDAELTMSHNEISKSLRDNSQAINDLMLEKTAHKLVRKLTEQIYPMALISRKNNQVIISQGGKSLRVGEKFKVYHRGRKIIDPYTKEFVGREETLCCTIEIERVSAKQSYAKILSGSSELPEVIPAKEYVLRDQLIAKNIKKKSPKKQSIKSTDNDW